MKLTIAQHQSNAEKWNFKMYIIFYMNLSATAGVLHSITTITHQDRRKRANLK